MESGLGKIVGGIVIGVVVTAISYYFFTDRPGAPEVVATEKTLLLRGEIIEPLLWDYMSKMDKVVDLEKLKEERRYDGSWRHGAGLRLVEIVNPSPQTYEDIEILTNGLNKVVVQVGDAATVYDGNLAGQKLRITPGANIQLLGIGDISSLFSDRTFVITIGGKAIPIDDLTLETNEMNFSMVMWLRKNSLMSYLVLIVAWSPLFVVTLVILVRALTRKPPIPENERLGPPNPNS